MANACTRCYVDAKSLMCHPAARAICAFAANVSLVASFAVSLHAS